MAWPRFAPKASPVTGRIEGAATPGDNSFWGQYLADNGTFGSAAGHAGGVWDVNIWNSARCDSAELNIFPVNGRQGNLSGLGLGRFKDRVRVRYRLRVSAIEPVAGGGGSHIHDIAAADRAALVVGVDDLFDDLGERVLSDIRADILQVHIERLLLELTAAPARAARGAPAGLAAALV